MQLLDIIIALFVAFLCRTCAYMILYATSYGQLLGWVKVKISCQLFPDETCQALNNIERITEGEKIMKDLYDQVAVVSFWMRLINCPYCVGFWFSILTAAGSAFFIGWEALIIPILTFFFIEKI